MESIEKLTRQRNWSLLFSACALLLWQGGMAVIELTGGGGYANGSGNGLVLAGSLMWVAAMVYFVRLQLLVKKARAGCVLNDEWARHTRLRALAAGFFLTFFSIAVAYVTLAFIDLPVLGVVHLIFVVALTAPLFSYVAIEFGSNRHMDQE